MNYKALAVIEDFLNNKQNFQSVYAEAMFSDDIQPIINELNEKIKEMNKHPIKVSGTTFYEDVIEQIKKLGNNDFLKKNGEVNESKFYTSAGIDKTSWNKLKYNTGKIKMVTVARLLSALKLDNEQKDSFYAKIYSNFGASWQNTIYENVIGYIKVLDNSSRFLKGKGEVKEEVFYEYAYIDNTTWNNIKKYKNIDSKKVTPSKKTILKLILALKMDKTEADDMLSRVNERFDYNDTQDKVICAIIETGYKYIYEVDQIVEILDFYKKNSVKPFISIYDNPKDSYNKNDKPEDSK